MARRRITQLVKTPDGSGHFQTIDDPKDVIKLAGRPGPFDLAAEYGVPEKLVEALDSTTPGLLFIPVVIVTAVMGSMVFSFLKDSQLSLLATAVPGYVGYVLAYAYIKAHGDNLVWDHTRLGGLRFNSTLRAGGMAKLYLTNALAIIASLGLMTPWAVMMTLKYRADNLQVSLEGDLTDFRGAEESSVQAVGAELGDFFDMDLSL